MPLPSSLALSLSLAVAAAAILLVLPSTADAADKSSVTRGTKEAVKREGKGNETETFRFDPNTNSCFLSALSIFQIVTFPVSCSVSEKCSGV